MRYAQFSLHLDGTASSDSVIPKGLTLLKFKVYFMCSPTHLNAVSGFQNANKYTLSFSPYLLRELMNFSLARLLTSFKVPSSGLLHLLTPVAGVCCSPERKQVEKFLRLLVESEFLLPFRSHSIGAKEPFTSFLEKQFPYQVVPRAQTRHGNCFSRNGRQNRHISKQSSISLQASPLKKAS